MFNILSLSSRSSLWNTCRKNHLKIQPACAACGSYKKIQVHHIEPFHVNPARELDPTNMITLCSNCHLVFGHLMDYSSWNSNIIQDAAVYYTKVQNRPYKIKAQNDSTFFTIRDVIIRIFHWMGWYYRP